MERKVMMMVMMDGAMIGVTVLGSSCREEDWDAPEKQTTEDAEHFFY
jgi:hypothetical protein